MIPKKIHFCWFGKKEYPELVKKCIKSWRIYLHDYEIIKWDETNTPLDTSYVKDAYAQKKWAFVADYVRCWVLYHQGGIYLDTDMLVLKSFNPLLINNFFVGCERENLISCGIIGSIPFQPILEEIMEYYQQKKFTLQNIETSPSVFTKIIQGYGVIKCHKILKINQLTLYPMDYFYPLPFEFRHKHYLPFIGPKTFTVHLWNASWHTEIDLIKVFKFRESFEKLVNRIYLSNPETIIIIINYCFHLLKYFLRFLLVYLKECLKSIIKQWLSPLFIKPVFNQILDRYPSFFLSRRHFLIPSEFSFNKNVYKSCKRENLSFLVNLSEHNGWRVFFNIFGKDTIELFNKIKPNYITFDIGANLGFYTLNFAKRASRGYVYSFEPDPINFTNLQKNISINSFNNIHAFNLGLGNQTIEASIEVVNKKNLGMNRVNLSKNNSNHNIKIITLDEFVAQTKVTRIDLIKIDVEGFEYNVLLGSKQSLLKYRPILFIEVCDNHLRYYKSSAKQLIKYIYELGYKNIVNANTNEPIFADKNFSNCFFDILCY